MRSQRCRLVHGRNRQGRRNGRSASPRQGSVRLRRCHDGSVLARRSSPMANAGTTHQITIVPFVHHCAICRDLQHEIWVGAIPVVPACTAGAGQFLVMFTTYTIGIICCASPDTLEIASRCKSRPA